MLYDYPDTAKFLTAAEKKFVIARLREDEEGLSHEYKNRFIMDAFVCTVLTDRSQSEG